MVYKTNNRMDKEKYECYNALICTASWTYDDWHCSGCHWKGMGVKDVEFGDEKLKERAAELLVELKTKIFSKELPPKDSDKLFKV